MNRTVIYFLVMLLLGLACQPNADNVTPSQASEADLEALHEAVRQYDAFVNTGNADGFATLWAEDAVQIPPDQPMFVGRERIRARIAEFLAKNDDQLASQVEKMEVSGDLAVVHLRFTEEWSPKSGGDTTSVAGNGVQIYKKHPDGSWLLSSEIWNHDAPMDEFVADRDD